jgi:hypothetical protein
MQNTAKVMANQATLTGAAERAEEEKGEREEEE